MSFKKELSLSSELRALSMIIRRLELAKGPDLATLKLLYSEEENLAELLADLNIKIEDMSYICNPSILPIGFPNSTLTAFMLKEYAEKMRSDLIKRSFDFLLGLFNPSADTLVPDILITLTFVKLLRDLNINATYGSHIILLPVKRSYLLTERSHLLTEESNLLTKMIPYIDINDDCLNIYGIRDYKESTWANYFDQSRDIKDLLKQLNVSIMHSPGCQYSSKQYENKIEDLFADRLNSCKCSVKKYKALLLDSIIRIYSSELNNYIKFPKQGRLNTTPTLFKLRYMFHGKMTKYNQIRRIFNKELLIHLFNTVKN